MPAPILVTSDPFISQIELNLELEDASTFAQTIWMMEMTLTVPVRIRTLIKQHLRGEGLLWATRHHMVFSDSGYPCSPLNSMDFLIWNIRGGGSKDFLRNIRELIRLYKPCVLVLVETRVQDSNAENLLTRIGYPNHTKVSTLGFAGGIWLLWKGDIVSVDVIVANEQVVHTLVKRKTDADWLFSAVYASPKAAKREKLWEFFAQVSRSHNLPWLVAGDFNEIINSFSKEGGNPSKTHKYGGLLACMDKCQLMDLGFYGSQFTWNNCREGQNRIRERLDKAYSTTALFSLELMVIFLLQLVIGLLDLKMLG